MAKNKFRITESDFLLANRKAAREEEIARFGKQCIFRTSTQKSKKVYDRKRLKKADIKNIDDLPLLYLLGDRGHSYERMNELGVSIPSSMDFQGTSPSEQAPL